MKVLNPTTSIVMASHMKPGYIVESIQSVLQQTRQDFQLIIIDSGEWTRYYDPMWDVQQRYESHPLIEWYTLGESPRLIDRACPYAYIWNRAVRELVRGKYVCFFTDDDLYKPNYIEKMAGYLDEHPEAGAVFCAQDRVDLRSGVEVAMAGIAADSPRSTFDNHIDMLQMMMRRNTFVRLPDPWFNEDPADANCRHADGQFMDRVGALLGEVPNIPDILVTHRHTSVSTYN